MAELDNAMREQVFSLPELLREQYKDLEPKTREVLTTPEIFDIQHIILVGLGDSYAACKSMKYAFEKLTGKRIEVLNALELSRFYEKKFLGGAPHDPLVIAVSNSGKVARMGEALMRVRKYGAFVLGVTGNEEGILAKNSDKILKLDIPKAPSAPGTRSYMVSLLALLLLAIRIGEVRGRYTMDKAKSYRKDILNVADLLEKELPSMDEKMLKLAKEWKDVYHWDFVGAGMDEATAWFGMAKVFEALGDFATEINSEEWLHLNFFMKDSENIGTIMILTKDNPALSRCLETLNYASILGRKLLVITDIPEKDFSVKANYVEVPKGEYIETSQLVQFAPLCLLYGYLMTMRGERAGRGCEGRWEISKGAKCVRESEIVIL